MLNDAVLRVGETIEYYIYRVGMNSVNNFSLGAAVGLVLVLCEEIGCTDRFYIASLQWLCYHQDISDDR